MAAISFKVNGRSMSVDVDPDTPLLYILTDDARLNGPKFGCGLSECGSCTVLLDGEPIRSCQTPMSDAAGREIVSIEGLGTPEKPHAIQLAFIAEQAVQCAYCVSGPMLYGKAFIDKNPKASEAEVLDSLSGLLCRCHAHPRMVKALRRYQAGLTQGGK